MVLLPSSSLEASRRPSYHSLVRRCISTLAARTSCVCVCVGGGGGGGGLIMDCRGRGWGLFQQVSKRRKTIDSTNQRGSFSLYTGSARA